MEQERRQYLRAPVDWPSILLTPQRFIGGETKNISPKGAFIHCLTDPGLDEPFRIVIKAPSRKQFLLVTAETAWSNISGCDDDLSSRGIGVRFTKVFSDDKRFLSNAVTSA